MFKIENNLLVGNKVTHHICNKDSGVFKPNKLDTIVAHFTAGSNLSGAYNTLIDPKVKACAHLIVDRDCTIYQLVPFNKETWHAGESKWRDRTFLNQYSIGVEIVNEGPLTPVNSDLFKSVWGKTYHSNEVMRAVHRNEKIPRFWQLYTPEQIDVCREIFKVLVEEYGIKHILGHEEISPGRKIDPGPAFPLDDMRLFILKNDLKSSTTIPTKGTVNVDKLNLRSLPNSTSRPIEIPFAKGTKISITEVTNSEWLEVSVSGYVMRKYIDTE